MSTSQERQEAGKPDGLALLRVDFPPHQISKLPKQMKANDQDKGRCTQGSSYTADGFACGGWHARSIHLDYVGHAALTDRLLDADPEWSWEPVAFGPDGLPQLDKNGGLWIRLTVCGVTRLGYGDAGTKSGPNAIKEAIGDGLRNAAMRFGAALDLWFKGDLHADEDETPKPATPTVPQTAEPSATNGPTEVRQQILAWARERNVEIPAVEAAFAKKHPDVTIPTASAKLLGPFLEALRNGEVLVGA